MGLQPKTVMIVLEDNETKEIPVSAIIPGNILLVRPGDKLAVDGVVTDGGSFVDESMISGEPVPVEKLRGDQVFAGTINQLGSFKIRAEKVGSETVLSQIIKMVQEAQGSKAPVQKLVDKISGIFVPVVIIISIVTFLTWMIAGGENAFTHALLNAITVLVIACPCALGLATPTAIMVGIGKGAENNILIKDADSLELAHKVNAVVLDKTGTITEGKPGVSEIVFIDGVDNEKFKAILFSLELQSEHPLAGAVTKHLKNEGVAKVNVQNIESITGKGITGQFEGVSYTAGNRKFLMEKGISMDVRLSDRFDQLQQEAKTVIAFAEGVQVIAIIAIADKIKSSSVRAVKNLGNLGIDVYMLTGDNLSTATAIARESGITTFKAEMLPAEKATFVKDLQAKGKVVAMAGDGINDSQALAQADLSIAMGKGSDIAMDVAQMTLITSDLTSIASALTLSRKTVSTIKQNLFWAFFYNLIGIPLAAGILYSFNGFLLDPMIAGAAMALSSVSVVGNSLRLKMAKI
jgi:Cu2+-exporting ATPase